MTQLTHVRSPMLACRVRTPSTTAVSVEFSATPAFRGPSGFPFDEGVYNIRASSRRDTTCLWSRARGVSKVVLKFVHDPGVALV